MNKKTTQSASSEAQLPNSKQTGGKKKFPMVAVLLIIIAISVIGAMAAVIYHLVNKDTTDNPERGGSSGPKRDTVVTMDNRDEILADLDNKVSDGLFETKMNVEWTFKNSSTPSENAYVANVQSNSNTFYFDVTLDSTGETIYESPYVPVGHALENITLKSDVGAGVHPCTLTYHLIDEDYNDVSTVAVAVTLQVLR